MDFGCGTYVSRSGVHMINYKQMRDENMMHLVMISAQKKPGLMNLTLLIMMRMKVRYIP